MSTANDIPVSKIPKEAGGADPAIYSSTALDYESGNAFNHGPAAIPRPFLSPSSDSSITTHEGRGVTREALSSSTEGLVLYDLTNAKGGTKIFSPHCLKTILDLRLLGVGYDRQKLNFIQVRTDLSSRCSSESVTVPTLELSDGQHLTDSWSIALYLSSKHPKGSRLFPNESSRPFANLLNTWGKVSLAPSLGPLTRPAVYSILDEDSKRYFEEEKIGRIKLEKMRNLSQEEKRKFIESCLSALELIEAGLNGAKELPRHPARKHVIWLEGGEEPTHADFVVYGWYVYTRASGPALTREVWHSHPLVSKWVEDLTDWAGSDISRDFF